jgi:hypothetical protein
MMGRRLLFLFCGLVFGTSPVHAQLVLPGAAPAAKGRVAAPSPKPKKSAGAASKGGTATVKGPKVVPAPSPGVASLAGQPLLLNGSAGLLQLSGDATAARIDKLRLAGEGVSDPSQRCVVDIVGEKPIEATSVGHPDGLERFEADVPACPFAFDVLNGSALVPSQITACVFKAADCQTNPSGLWGPDGSSLERDAAEIAEERLQAEKAMGKVVHAIESRAENNPEAANLMRDQSAFAGRRDDACRDYVKESVHGFCATRLTEARNALLQSRLDALGPEPWAKPEKKKKKSKQGGKAQ